MIRYIGWELHIKKEPKYKQRNEILRNEAISNATYFKQWEESGNSMSLSYSRNQNFENNNNITYDFIFEPNLWTRKWTL